MSDESQRWLPGGPSMGGWQLFTLAVQEFFPKYYLDVFFALWVAEKNPAGCRSLAAHAMMALLLAD